MSEDGSIMDRLRSETAAQHKVAESRPFARAMARGGVSRQAYAAFLVQRHAVHRELEARLRELAAADPRAGAVLDESLFQETHVESDLAFLGVDSDGIAPPARSLIEWIDQVARERPIALLGINYVLEGSKNGAAFVARSIRKSLRLASGAGTRYLDPHGAKQRELWLEFRARMAALEFTPTEADAIVDAAKQTFDRISDCDDAVCEAADDAGSVSSP